MTDSPFKCGTKRGSGHLGALEAANACYARVLELAGDDKQARAAALGNMGVLARIRGDLDESMRPYGEALALARELGEKERMASDFGNMGTVARTRGDLDGAMRLYDQALALDKELGSKEGMAADLCNIGLVEEQRRNFAKARALYVQALAIYDEIGAGQGEFATFYRDRLAKLTAEGH